MTRSHFYRNFEGTYQIFIRSRCPVDRVFRNCGVRNSEVLLYVILILICIQRKPFYIILKLVMTRF